MARRRKRPRLFSFSREVEIGHFEEVVTDPEEREALEQVVDAFLAICADHAVSQSTLMPIARAARHTSPYLRGVGITRLAVLCHYFDEAVAVMEQVTRDEDAQVRLYATSALANTPESVGVPLLSRLLNDPEWTVRKAAAQAGSAVAWSTLLPVLEERVNQESDARVKVLLQLARDFQASRLP